MSHPQPVKIRNDAAFEEAYSLLARLERHSEHTTMAPSSRVSIALAMDELCLGGLETVHELFDLEVAPDTAQTLAAVTQNLGKLIANSYSLQDTLRYTRALDYLRCVRL